MILVTGATGNVGRGLVPLWLEKGQPVRVLVRDEGKAAQLGERVQRAVGDLNEPRTLVAAMRGIDRLFMVTAQPQQVVNLLEAAKQYP